MKKRMSKFLLTIIIALFCNQNAFAQKVIVGTKEMPLEISLLIEGLQSQSPDNYAKILPLIMNIDLYARSMSKEDIFLIGKIEIYKTLLKNYNAVIRQPVDGSTLATLRTALTKTDDNFTKWFLQALLKDALELTSNSKYKEFLLQKNNNIKLEKIEYRKLEKKGELIQSWVSRISPELPDFPESLTNELTPKMFSALKNIQGSFYLIAKEGTLAPIASELKNETEMKFFTVQDEVSPKKAVQPKAEKSVEEILGPDTINPTNLPRPTQENWLQDENMPPTLQNLPKPNNDADWLQDF